jgi:hypothetical protein
MKKIIACLIALVVYTVAKAQTESPFLTKSLANAAIQKVVAHTSGGSIAVTGQTAGESRVEVYIRSSNNNIEISKEEIQKRLDNDYELSIGVAGNQLTVTARQKDGELNWKKALSISFKIFVSPNASTELNTRGGSISLVNLKGKHDFSTSGGSLNIDQLSGGIDGKTSGGSIRVANSRDEINLSTRGGSIKADNCKGTIKLSTSGGSMDLNNLEGAVDADTRGGSIRSNNITGDLMAHTSGGSVGLQNLAGSVDASTNGGSMTVGITKLGKYVRLANSGGSVNLTIPDGQGINLKLHSRSISVATLKNFSGNKSDDEIDGTLNGGGIPVDVRVNSGRITMGFN